MSSFTRAARRLFFLPFVATVVAPAAAQITPPAGYIYAAQLLGSPTQNCIATGPGGTFVAIGPGFSANAQAVVLVRESGDKRLVAFGFSSIGDCTYDAAADVLYISDNADADDVPGALTGDTVFAVPAASTASGLLATDLELLPAGSIPFASSVALHSSGDLLVGDAAGSGAGTVLRIAPGPAISTFASDFDFTGGIAVDPLSGDVFIAETRATFDAQIHQFDSAGSAVAEPLLGPTFAVGSSDLLFLATGELLASGVFFGDVSAIDVATASPTLFVGGLTFAGGMTANTFTGRIEMLSSSFTGAAEDKSLHRFTPVENLTPGSGSDRTECLHELYGIALVAPALDRPAKKAICVDGAPCDADGRINDECLFPVGSCLNVFDPNFLECDTSTAITEFAVSSRPHSPAIQTMAANVAAALPIAGATPSCFFSDGVTVPLRVSGSGVKKAGKAKVTVAASNAAGKRDRDTFSLVCEPAQP